MECLPPLSDDVESDAWLLLRTMVPSEVEPSKNSTVPVAVDGETVAVKVTRCPLFDGFESDVNVIVVLALFTVCKSAEDVLLVWVASPLYCAVMECVPTARVDVENVATPLALSAEIPSVEAPSMNVTVPVAPEDGLTVAENVTCCP
jgi:hypothetical protein